MNYRKKLIEVALPLEEINVASAREKSIRHGHPSTLHLWWARRPLATCRAVLFSSIIDDPGEEGVPQELLDQIDQLPLDRKYRNLASDELDVTSGEALSDEEAERIKVARERRYRLFTFIERLVQWENSNDEDTLTIARDLINAATGGNPPPVLDPFCGGGSIPLEAQRLGLEAHGSDLNPVAVLITKAMIEIPPKFAGQPPVNPLAQANLGLSKPLPPETEDFEIINEFGHTFDVKAAFNGKDAVELHEMAKAMEESWNEVGVWQGTLDELRGAMIFFLRQQRHWGENPTPGTDRYVLFTTLHQAIREAWSRTSSTQAAPSLPMNVTFRGAQGLAEDVRYYGQWIRDEAESRIGHLYPKVVITAEMAENRPELKELVGDELTVIAWLWARTVPSPDPAAQGAHVPLVRSFDLSSKKGKEAWIEPIVDPVSMSYKFEVRTPKSHPESKASEGTIGRQGGKCLLTGSPMSFEHIRTLAKGGQMNHRLMAIVAEGVRGRIYLPPSKVQEEIVRELPEIEPPTSHLPEKALGFRVQAYGMSRHSDLFTSRQLVALTTFGDLVSAVRERVLDDAISAGKDHANAAAYANAISTYLAFAADKGADYWSSLCSWHSSRELIRNTFGRQAIPMVWDFAECNPMSESTGNWMACIDWVWKALKHAPAARQGISEQADATKQTKMPYLFSTDPPYFDNIGYADLSDYFYVWLRRSLGVVYPDLFTTVVTPKSDELIATPYRHEGSKEKATQFFENGLRQVFARMRDQGLPEFPTTIYYAFKQSETEESEDNVAFETASTGWETMLQGLVDSGFAINGTWPTRTELANRMVASGTNALASCIVLVCRQRPVNAEPINRRQFMSLLRQELKPALIKLTQGNVAPVDLAQAAIGPGMAVFSRYKSVLEADGTPMRVRTALTLINQGLDEALAEQEGWYDAQTRWAVTWFQQRGFDEGPYGDAEILATAKDAPVTTMVEAGIVKSGGGKVKLLSREELPVDYDPETDPRTTVWEATQYLVRELEVNGELGAARMMRRFRETKPEVEIDRGRELAYRLYAICDGKRWTNEARGYNALVLSWSDIEAVSQTDDALWGASVSAGPGTGPKRNETPSFEGMTD